MGDLEIILKELGYEMIWKIGLTRKTKHNRSMSDRCILVLRLLSPFRHESHCGKQCRKMKNNLVMR